MNDELLHGWAHCPVEKAFRSFGGGTPNKGTSSYWKGSIPWLSSGDIKTERIHSATEFITRAGLENSSANLCRPGSVLVVVRSGVLKHTLPVAVLEREAAINQDIKCFDSGCSELNEWLSLALRASANDILALNREGTTVQSVKYETLKEFDLSIPPLAEQKRIVAKLEKLSGQVDACQKRLAKIPALLKRFRQSVLAAACSGRLTADWRENNPDTEEWKSVELLDISEKIQIGPFGTQLHKADYVFNGVPLINPTHIQNSKVAHDPEFSISRTKLKELGNYVLREGDIVIGRRGEMGRCALISKNESGWLCGTGSLFVRPKSGVSPEFVFLVLRSPETKAFLESESKGTTMSNLNLEILNKVPVFLSSFTEQQEIVRRVENLFALADRIEVRFAEGRKRVDSITQSILAKAFRGELVPTEAELAKAEGRSFESAEELLERIGRNGIAKKPPVRQKGNRPDKRSKRAVAKHR